MTAALKSFTQSTRRLRFWGSGSLVESKWCHYIIVEADSQLKLLSVSILDIYKVFEQIDMLSISIWQQPYTVIPTLICSDFGVLGHLLSWNDVIIMSWLRLTAASNCFLHQYQTCQSVWTHWYVVIWHTVAALHSFTHTTWLRFWG